MELLTAWLQVDRFSMEKEEITDVELFDGAVVHIRKAGSTHQDLANWPTHGSEIDSACISKFRAWIASVAPMLEVEKGPKRVCVL